MAHKNFYKEFTVANTYSTMYTVPSGKKFTVTFFMTGAPHVSQGFCTTPHSIKVRVNGTDELGYFFDPDGDNHFKGMTLVAGDEFEVMSNSATDANYKRTAFLCGVEENA